MSIPSLEKKSRIHSVKILILAGGYATRLWPLSEHKAKALLLLNGKTMLEHLLAQIPLEHETIILTNKKFEQDFKKTVSNIERNNIEIFCENTTEEKEKTGALGAIALVCAQKKIQEDIVVFAGDNFLPELPKELFEAAPNEAFLVGKEVASLAEARSFGVLETKNIDGKMHVIGFEEKPQNPKSVFVSTGFMRFGKNLIPSLQAFAKKNKDALGKIFEYFLSKKIKITTEVSNENWFDIGSFHSYLEAHKVFQQKEIENDKAKMSGKNNFNGKVFIGENSLIQDSQISNSLIYPNCKLIDCSISECIIDKGVHLEGVDLNRKIIRSNTTVIAPKTNHTTAK